MPVVKTENAIVLNGVVTVEEAESLHQQLLAQPASHVTYEALEHVHAAVVQVLLAHGRALPDNLFPVTACDCLESV